MRYARPPYDAASALASEGRLRWWWAWLAALWLVWPSEAAAAPAVEGPPPLELELGRTDQPLTLRFGASVWGRGTVRSRPPESTEWAIPQRTRLSADVHWRGIGAFVQVQDVREWGTEPSTTSTPATTGMHQAYFELGGSRGEAEGFIRVGRQEHFLGSMRLIGTAPWNPHMRSLDAIRMRGSHGPFSLDLAGALVRAPGTLTLVDDAGTERSVRHHAEGLLMGSFGVAAHEAAQLEVYALAHNQQPTESDPERDHMVLSPGIRVTGKPWRGLSYDVEGYVQSGRWDGRGHEAYLGAATVGYRFGGRVRPLVELGTVVATGGGCEQAGEEVVCDDGVHRDVDGFFGARHRFLGILDGFAPTNVIAAWGGFRLEPTPWMELRTEVYHFMLFDPTGRWLATNDSIVGSGPDPSNTERTVGEELDLRLSLHPWGPLTIQAGYAVLVPTGAGPGMIGEHPYQLGYLLTQVAF